MADHLFILPMRNWNIFSVKLISWPPALFILPMRNWNAAFCASRSSSLPSFYITYEELKRHKKIFFYWEIFLFILPMRNWNSSSSDISETGVSLFILPMRNWNTWRVEDRVVLHIFLYYLWGIETIISLFQ